MNPSCKNCGAPLEGAPYEAMVTCRHCNGPQENLACLRVDDEVLRTATFGFELGRVTACRGPKDIDIEVEGKPFSHLRLEDLVPVLRPSAPLTSGTLIYFRDMMGWKRSWTSSASGRDSVKVKHEDPKFQDPFFDTSAMLSDVRVPAKPAQMAKRSAIDAYLDRLKGDPFGMGVSLVIKVVGAFFVLVFLSFAVRIVYGIATGR